MIEKTDFPGRLHFIGHAVRDILNRLPEVLTQSKRPRVEYASAFDELAKLWDSIGTFQKGQRKPETIAITFRAARIVDSLVTEHKESRAREPGAQLLLQHLMQSDPTKGNVNARLVDDLEGIRKWFVGHTHLPATPKQVDEEELQQRFRAFESMLHSFVGDFFTAVEELDSVLDKANR
jgi:hypothetical protein